MARKPTLGSFCYLACWDGTASAELEEHSSISLSHPVKHICEAPFHGLLRQTVPGAQQQVLLSPALPQTPPGPQLDVLRSHQAQTTSPPTLYYTNTMMTDKDSYLKWMERNDVVEMADHSGVMYCGCTVQIKQTCWDMWMFKAPRPPPRPGLCYQGTFWAEH